MADSSSSSHDPWRGPPGWLVAEAAYEDADSILAALRQLCEWDSVSPEAWTNVEFLIGDSGGGGKEVTVGSLLESGVLKHQNREMIGSISEQSWLSLD